MTAKRLDTPTTGASTRPYLFLLVLMITVLFVAMIAAGVILTNQIGLVAANATNTAWAEPFTQANRALLFILGFAALFLLAFFGLFIINLRRYGDERSQEQAAAARHQLELRTQLNQLAGELNGQREQLQAILGTVQEGVIYTEGGKIRYANKALARLLGYGLEEITQLPAPNGASRHPLAVQFGEMQQVIQSGTGAGGMWQGPYKLKRKDGTELDVSVIGAPVSGARDRTITIIRDASQEKRLQLQKTRFISNTAHELRTPLSTLVTRLYLLRRTPERLEEHLQVMESTTAYMKQLVEEMIDHVRFERGVMMLDREDGILQELISEAVRNYTPKAERRDVTLLYEPGDQRDRVFVDHKRIVQVLNNLIANGLNHTPNGGKVQVNVLRAPADKVAVEVQDFGPAISQDKIAHVFQPFEEASQGVVSGTVLGLTLAKEIIELHGGEITLTSNEGRGTFIRFTLPRVVEAVLPASVEVSDT